MNIISVKNPIYSNSADTAIDCEVVFDGGGMAGIQLSYTATPNDTTTYGIALWAALQAGAYGPIAAYVAPPAPHAPPVDPIADLINALIANGTLTANQLQATTIATVNTNLAAAGQTAIASTLKVTP